MAEGEGQRRAPLYRSVSFQRLAQWIEPAQPEGGGGGSRGGGGGGAPRGEPPPPERPGAQPRQAYPPSARAQPPPPEPIGRRSPGRAASFSVSRPAAEPGDRALRSLSPSVRQLSRRFCAPRGGAEEDAALGPASRGRATCGRAAAAAAPQTDLAGAEAGGGPQPEQPPAPPPRSSSGGGGPKGPSEPAALDWPSVTEMRKLFGESFRRQQQPQAAEPRGGPGEDWAGLRGKARPLAPEPPGAAPPRQPGVSEGGGGGGAAAPLRLPDGPALPGGRSEDGACFPEERRGAPPPPPPRSCIPFPGLRAQRGPRGPAEKPPQLWDTSHSWHSSPSPAAAAASASSPAWGGWVPPEVSSSSEDELRPPPALAPAAPGGNGWRSSPERSSGSEEDPRLPAPRRRSLRKKKRDPEAQDQAPLGARAAAAGMEWHLKAQRDLSGGLLPAGEEERTGPAPPAEARGARNGAEGHRPLSGGPPGGSRPFPSNFGPLSSGPPLPLVSRVSKVNIPPFASSPSGSRGSSRYSSTETLKEDDQLGGSWAGPSKASLGLCRVPSFGEGDGPARLQPQVRARPKLPLGFARAKQEPSSFENLLPCGLEAAEKSKHQKSMSNPDITSETLALLSFLKSDLSELKARKRGSRLSDQEEMEFGGGGGSRYEHYHPGGAEHQLVGRTQGELQPPSCWALGSRPSLKDLTATLRRAKSFTCSDKPAPRRLFLQNAMKQSSSELLLPTSVDHNGLVSDGDVGRGREEEVLPVIIQDQYIQEARQVFEKISKIGSEHNYSFALDSKENFGKGEREEVEPLGDKVPEESCGQCLKKADSEENLSCGKQLEEGPESSMTDEGIVTEPETSPAYSYLDPSVAAWKLANRRGSEGGPLERKEKLLPNHLTKGNNEKVAAVDEVIPNHKMVSQGLLEAPLTPSALRRRRKFPSMGNNGSESSNGSSGESSGESYRSLSDPMPHRRCSITEDSKNFSVDSNLLGPLNSKPGVLDSSAVALSNCTGSAASDLSVCSDGIKDYSTVIQNIVSQPGAMDRVIDEKGNGKPIKKKSFSDPSRRGEHASPGFMGAGEPISEMDQNILPSSSEPILSEQRGQPKEQEVGRLSSQSEQILPMPPEDNAVDVPHGYSFDPKLAEVLSPRIVRRSSKKRSDRVNSQESRDDDVPCSTVPTTLGRARPTSKHVRHTSEPATFIPISDVSLPSSVHQNAHPAMQELPRLPSKPYPVLQVPSLEDVTKHYMLTLSSGEPLSTNTVDTPGSSPATPTTSEPKLPRCPKHHGDGNASSSRSKPQVDYQFWATKNLNSH